MEKSPGEGRGERAVELFHEAYHEQMRGDLEAAIRLYRASIAVSPTAEAHTFLGWTLSFQGKLREAIAECEKAIRVDPEFGNPWNDIGVYLIDLGETEKAIPYFRKAIRARRYESYCFPHFNLGRVYEMQGLWSRALASYEASLRENPDYPLAREAFGRLRAMMN
jgi:tetratricopeptide (TPR) repeat protein